MTAMAGRPVIYCERCPREHVGAPIGGGVDAAAAIERSRRFLRGVGWQCDDGGDVCSTCLSGRVTGMQVPNA